MRRKRKDEGHIDSCGYLVRCSVHMFMLMTFPLDTIEN